MLALTHRPPNFDSVVGNEATVESLQSVLNREEGRPHAILLVGPSGCGKTTLGRIVANHLGAYDPESRQNLDYTELDTADFRGIESIRAIRNKMGYSPVSAPCRVWLLDEVHRLTGDAQSALLKSLEDAPDHVYFILATTDPQKLLPTIRGRCSIFKVNLLDYEDTMSLLVRVVSAEKKKVPKQVLEQIAKDSCGQPRTALVTLDKIIDLPREKMLHAAQVAVAQENQVIDLCRALLARKKWSVIAGLIKNLDEDAESARRPVLHYFSSVLLGGKADPVVAYAMQEFSQPFYNGKPDIILACYNVINLDA
jgi:DNA polymerase III subunit gamma/tau